MKTYGTFNKSMLHSGNVVKNRDGNFYLVIENNEGGFLFSREDGSWYNDDRMSCELTMENNDSSRLDIIEIYFSVSRSAIAQLFSGGLRYVENNIDWMVVDRRTLPKYTYSDLVKLIGHKFEICFDWKDDE